jgi:hypothetical protein
MTARNAIEAYGDAAVFIFRPLERTGVCRERKIGTSAAEAALIFLRLCRG